MLVNVKFHPKVNEHQIINQMGLAIHRSGIIPNLYQIQVPDSGVDKTIKQLSSHSGIKYAEPVKTVYIRKTPNDPYYVSGGQPELNGRWGINAPAAWDFTTGSKNVIVAVVDTGIDYNHPDIVGNLAYSGGWNFIANNNNPLDDNGHGTFTAGQIGAVGNNASGIAGVCWNIQLMAIKTFNSSGGGSDFACAEGIHYAVDHGASVINCSWGAVGQDATVAEAIQYANQHNVIVVCAAGNYALNITTTFFFPASYSTQYPNVISVAAVDKIGALAGFSNYGVGTVQLAAPGVNVVGLANNGLYTVDTGTSMAAPYVAGAVALIKAYHPGWTMSQIIQSIINHTTPDPNLVGLVTTGGILNAAAALTGNQAPTLVSIPNKVILANSSTTITLNGSDSDGDILTYGAVAQTQCYWLNQTYGFFEDSGGYYLNYRGKQEKYLRAEISANNYGRAYGIPWYYVLPNGDLYEFTPDYSRSSLVGVLLTNVGVAVYNDPSLLWNAQNVAVPVSLTISSNNLTIVPNVGYGGIFYVVASVNDNQGNLAYQSFAVTVQTNPPPTLAPISNQSMGRSPATLNVTLSGSDVAGNPLTYSAITETQNYWLRAAYGIYEDAGGYYLNYRGQQEKYLRGKISANNYYNSGGGDFWYYVLPNGGLYEFTPPYTNASLAGNLVTNVGMTVYNDPSLLWNAQNASVAVLTTSGNILTIAPNSGFTGMFIVVASVSDNYGNSASQSFQVNVS